MKGFENYWGAVGKNSLFGAIFYNGFVLTVVRVFAAFQCPPLIKFEDSNKLAKHQNPALSVEHVLQIVATRISTFSDR